MQPKKTKLQQAPRACPRCGMPAARLKRQDHYLSLFFVPLIPLKRGQTFLECDQCGAISSPQDGIFQAAPESRAPSRCPFCGRDLQADFAFCPSCGRRL